MYNLWKNTAHPATVAFGFIIGCGAYFLFSSEPSVATNALLSMVLVASFYILQRHHHNLALLLLGLSAIFAGIAYTSLKANNLQPLLAEKYSKNRLWITGQITDLSVQGNRDKTTLKHLKIYGVPDSDTPEKIRLSSYGGFREFKLGDWLSVQAKLISPTPPAFNGDFDYRRYAYLNGVGASGFIMGDIYQTSRPATEAGTSELFFTINHIRSEITNRIIATGSEHAGLAAALLTGIRKNISVETKNAFRDSGLAHLLAISGLHLGMVGGMIFFVFRRAIGFHPRVILAINTKKVAAIFGIVGVVGYMLLAGTTIPTVRAAIMICLLFFAMLINRLRNPTRVLCIAAIIVLLIWPESVISASFQMSFAAAFALVLWAHMEKQAHKNDDVPHNKVGYIKGLFLVSLLAGIATIPLSAWHFQQVSLSGFLANMVAIPLTGLWVLPMGIVTLATMPFGLEAVPLSIMLKGAELLTYVATYASSTPLAAWHISSGLALQVAIVGGLILLGLLIYGKWVVFIPVFVVWCVALALIPTPIAADIIWLRGGKTILVATNDGLVLATGDKSSNERYLLKKLKKTKNYTFADKGTGNCDATGCIYTQNNHDLLVMNSGYMPSVEDCLAVDIIITENVNIKNCSAIFTVPTGAIAGERWWSNGKIKTTVFNPQQGRIWQ